MSIEEIILIIVCFGVYKVPERIDWHKDATLSVSIVSHRKVFCGTLFMLHF